MQNNSDMIWAPGNLACDGGGLHFFFVTKRQDLSSFAEDPTEAAAKRFFAVIQLRCEMFERGGDPIHRFVKIEVALFVDLSQMGSQSVSGNSDRPAFKGAAWIIVVEAVYDRERDILKNILSIFRIQDKAPNKSPHSWLGFRPFQRELFDLFVVRIVLHFTVVLQVREELLQKK